MTPAADAGPRQPWCPECNSQLADVRLCLDCGTNHGHSLPSNRGHNKVPCTNAWHPPVPQKAAPRVRHSDGIEGECLGCEDCNPESAPDSAMRVAEQIIGFYMFGTSPEKPFNAESVAALIREREFCEGCDHGVVAGKVCELCGGTGYKERRRQAGSERERELTRRLQITLADIDTLLEIADSNVHPKVLDMIKLSRAEASRLLGGMMTAEQFRIRHSDGIGGECPGCEDCNPTPQLRDALSQLAEKEREIKQLTQDKDFYRTTKAEWKQRAEAAEERLKEAQARPFCEGCDHGVVSEGICELCQGMGYKERRSPPHLGKRLQEAQAEIKLLRHNRNEALKGEDDSF